MSTMYKMIIPLLHKDLTKDDVNPDKGFVDIFSEDINRPYYDNCIFLMYKWDTTETSYFRREKFKSLGIVKNERIICINNTYYVVFTITITNPEIKRILKGLKVSNYADKMRIIKFWNFEEGDVNTVMFTSDVMFNYEHKIIPEEDYRGEDETEKGLVIPKGIADPFLFI